jgi:hypothetical protein
LGHKRALRQFSINSSLPIKYNAFIQRKSSCARGGRCKRCQNKINIQTKLKINAPSDKYEREADRVAEQVMRMPGPPVQPLNSQTEQIHTILLTPGIFF